ncbi:hypothetical protein BDF14DRAFT_1825748 [Spinellus fusiger]|nr:hypothetical protein BDF14DRAFT_1825748 [Spinellus fusiger]
MCSCIIKVQRRITSSSHHAYILEYKTSAQNIKIRQKYLGHKFIYILKIKKTSPKTFLGRKVYFSFKEELVWRSLYFDCLLTTHLLTKSMTPADVTCIQGSCYDRQQSLSFSFHLLVLLSFFHGLSYNHPTTFDCTSFSSQQTLDIDCPTCTVDSPHRQNSRGSSDRRLSQPPPQQPPGP